MISLGHLAHHHADDVRAVPAHLADGPRDDAARRVCSTRRWPATNARWPGRCSTAASCSRFSSAPSFSTWSCSWSCRKGFFPEQDTGRLIGSLQADQSVSFQLMTQKLRQMMADRAAGSRGGECRRLYRRRLRRRLRPDQYRLGLRLAQADVGSGRRWSEVIARLRPETRPGSRRPAVSGRRSRTSAPAAGKAMPQYQYTLQSDDAERPVQMDASAWSRRLNTAR